jgi:hypothetical protein
LESPHMASRSPEALLWPYHHFDPFHVFSSFGLQDLCIL